MSASLKWNGYHIFAIEHLKSLEALNIYQNSVIIFDRGYYSEKLFRYCVEHGHTCLMRLKNNYNIAKKCSGDICTILHEQSKDGTKDIDTRVIEITLPDGKKEYLATNLFDKSITQKMFSELYFYRWLLSNLSSLIKNQADDEIGITADSSNKNFDMVSDKFPC